MFNLFRAKTSTHPESSLRCGISFLPPGVNARYQLELTREPSSLVSFFDVINREYLSPLLTQRILTNVKGGGSNDSLLQLAGVYTNEEEEQLPFSYSISTAFHDFAEKDSIRFTWREERDGILLDDISRNDLTSRKEFLVEKVSLTLDFFKSTVVTRLTGFGPVAAESVLLELSPVQATLAIRADGLEDSQKLPLQGRTILDSLERAFSLSYGYSVISDYRKHQEALK